MTKTMLKSEAPASGSVLKSFFSAAPYKRTQGRIARFATFAALAAAFALGALRMYGLWPSFPGWIQSLPIPMARFAVPTAFFAITAYLCHRLVNIPSFADFLISVEAEMNKVSWPTQKEVVRSSLVVIVMIITLVVVLFAFDFLWTFLLRDVLGVLKSGVSGGSE